MISIDQLIQKLDTYKIGEVDRRPKKRDLYFINEFVHCISLDSSNHYVSSASSSMDKQWSIIFKKIKEFSSEIEINISQLKARCDFDITPVRTGENTGCFGFRFYHMTKNPDETITKHILDFIFQDKSNLPLIVSGSKDEVPSPKLIGTTIVHPAFGSGEIFKTDDFSIHVRFKSGNEKTLSYKWCVQNHILSEK